MSNVKFQQWYSFEYDNLERLEEARASIVSTSVVTNLIETTYSANGNIESKTDAGIYAYDTQKKNAVLHVGNDLEQISFNTQEILYTPSAKSARITEGDKRMYFTYGAQDERIMTKLVELDNGNENILLKKYFVGMYEKEVEGTTERHIHYIMAGDGLTAIAIQEDEDPAETYFTYKDHLGSIVTLTDDNGDVFFEQSFDAWGRYRNPDNWTYSNIAEPPTWLRGYTGHEHLAQFDLVNMNGRMYDPKLGRMLRPDNFVPDPLFTQAYNRYAYAYNNPLKYTDPDGENPILIGMVVGAYIGGLLANEDAGINPLNWDWTSGSTYNGIFYGTLAGVSLGIGISGGGGASSAAAAKNGAGVLANKLIASGFSGGINVISNYDAEKGVGWHTLGDFAVGAGGSLIGIEYGALAGMTAGGILNIALNYGQAENRDLYWATQKFASGAMSSLAGIGLYGKWAGTYQGNYIKVNGKYLFGKSSVSKWMNKGISYGLQNLANDFAYTDRKYYTDRFKDPNNSSKIFAGIFLAGFANGALQGMAFDSNVERVMGNKFYQNTIFQAGMSISGLLSEYVGSTFSLGYNPAQYSGLQQKMYKYGTKALFYNLQIK